MPPIMFSTFTHSALWRKHLDALPLRRRQQTAHGQVSGCRGEAKSWRYNDDHTNFRSCSCLAGITPSRVSRRVLLLGQTKQFRVVNAENTLVEANLLKEEHCVCSLKKALRANMVKPCSPEQRRSEQSRL